MKSIIIIQIHSWIIDSDSGINLINNNNYLFIKFKYY